MQLHEASKSTPRVLPTNIHHPSIPAVRAVQEVTALPRLQIIEAPPSQKRHRSSSSRGQSKPKVQIIPARQRVLSKLGLLHSSSLKQLVQIRPPRLPGQCERANHSKAAHCPVRGAESRQQSNTCRVAVKRDANSPQAATSSKLSSKSRPVPQRENSVTDPGSLISRQQGVRAQAPVRVPKEECTPSGQLVEDDIEWGASEAAQACATVLPHVASEQPWTVQYLEGHQVDTARDQMLGRHVSCGHLFTQKSQLPSGSKPSDVLGDKAQVKHGTGIAGWVEDEIQWD